MSDIKTQQELYDLWLLELQNQAPELTDDNEGSNIDVLGGATSVAVDEILQAVVREFAKTFFDTAHGPEVTGSVDDLQTLAVDHFGSQFARPAATYATGVVTFSRPTSGAGNILIPAGTIVKTPPNASGVSQRFATETNVTITGLTINATVNAVVAGSDGNVQDNTVTIVESALLDPTITVNNALDFAAGAEALNDADYRDFIRNKLLTLAGATIAAIEAAARNVPGVELATAIENEFTVIEYDIGTDDILLGAEYFWIPRVILYVADANGTASPALIADVVAAVKLVRAAGVRVEVQAAIALQLNWTANITLNISGPNYAELASDPQKIIDTMVDYLQNLPVGTGFVRTTANAAMLAIWGPAGTNDLTAGGFTTPVPSGDVPVAANEKIIAGTVAIA